MRTNVFHACPPARRIKPSFIWFLLAEDLLNKAVKAVESSQPEPVVYVSFSSFYPTYLI